jgi:hypothetical protein
MKLLTLLMTLAGTTLLAANPPGAGKSVEGFDRLKTLVGNWQGKDPEGKPASVSYKLVSAGSALMETLGMEAHKDAMVTMYHLDGDNLMMTHYCSVGNQPRMKADPAGSDANQIAFSFLDATNMASPDDPHMHALLITFKDKNHFSATWTMRAQGKDMPPKVFAFERKK